MKKKANRIIVPVAVTLSALIAGLPDAQAQGKSYTWKGADGGNWAVAGNWDDGSVPPDMSTGSPGTLDLAQFQSFSGTVTGSVGANVLDVGPDSNVNFMGSGFFSQITLGQDLVGNTGTASLTVGSGDVISATLLNIGSAVGGTGTLVANGTFTTNGGIAMDQTGLPGTLVVGPSGGIVDSSSPGLTMAAGGMITINSAGYMVIGQSDTGTNGALTIENGHSFNGEGTINGNVIVNGTLETFNAGWPVYKLIVNGNVSGSGSVNVVQEMDLNGAVGSGVTVSLFSNGGSNKGLLRLADPLAFAGKLGTMSTGSIIALSGASFDQISQSASELTLTGGSGTLTLAMTGDHSSQSFHLQPDATSGTDIVVDAGGSLPSSPHGDFNGDGKSRHPVAQRQPRARTTCF